MLRTMFTATNTLAQAQKKIDYISENLANNSTIGYKTNHTSFSELLYQQYDNEKFDRAQRQSPVGIRYGVGTKIGQLQSNQKQGSLQRTDRKLDFALTKEDQYFNVRLEDGETVYTRNGAFYTAPVEPGILMLVNGDGYPVLGSNDEPITFPEGATDYTMSEAGLLRVKYDNYDENFEIGVTHILKPQEMQRISSGTYIKVPDDIEQQDYTEADLYRDLQGQLREQVGMHSGVLEMSNVDISKEMSDLITAQRSYQFNTRAISIADDMLGLINGIR